MSRWAEEIVASEGSAWGRGHERGETAERRGIGPETVERFGRIDVLLNNAAIDVSQQLWKGRLEGLPIENGTGSWR